MVVAFESGYKVIRFNSILLRSYLVDVNKNLVPALFHPRYFPLGCLRVMSQERGMLQFAVCLANDSELVLLQSGAADG